MSRNNNQGNTATGSETRTGKATDEAGNGHEAGPTSRPTNGTYNAGAIDRTRRVQGAEFLSPGEVEPGLLTKLKAKEVTEITLWKISQCIAPEQFTDFGLSFGRSKIRISSLEFEMAKGISFAEAAFKVLHEWDQDQKEGQVHSLFDILVRGHMIDKTVFLSMFEEENLQRDSDQSTAMEERQLWDVAEKVSIDKYIPVGLRLGLTYTSLQSAREGTKTAEALFESLWRWQKGLSSNVDQPETLALVLEACQLRKLAHTIRQNHLSVTNAGKTMVIAQAQPTSDKDPAEQRDVQLLVCHTNPKVQKNAEDRLKNLLLPIPDDLQPQDGEARESLRKKIHDMCNLLKENADCMRSIQKAVRKLAVYELSGFTLDSIHLSVRMYNNDSYTYLMNDIGLIGRQLGNALIPPDTRQGLPDSISFDVTLEEKGLEGATLFTNQSSQRKRFKVDAGRLPSPIIDDDSPSHGQRKDKSQVQSLMSSDVHRTNASSPGVQSLQHGVLSLEPKTKETQEVHGVVERMPIAEFATIEEKEGTRHAAAERGKFDVTLVLAQLCCRLMTESESGLIFVS
ncbi:uncharacterized protein [Diadema antillarum]|uniref:uncharacterized protein n=1 Tax=Diadema antillarum TaxID=105358 RepID=UPI003A888CD7